MLGAWTRFGEGQPPDDGEAVLWITEVDANLIEGGVTKCVVPAIHRFGMLYEQNGSCYGIPYGSLWTSIPPLPRLSRAELVTTPGFAVS